jgi:hypothetical protein
MEYTLSIALVDFLPVIFTAMGLIAITRMVAHVNSLQGRVALFGALLTVAGGFFKATWKLLMASSNGAFDIRWMDEALFIFMAPGYTLLAWSVWQTVCTVQGKRTFHAWIPPLVIIGVIFVASVYLFITRPESPAWERILLSLMVLATIITGILLIVFSFRQRLPIAGWLFILNLVGIFLLNGLARLDEQTIALQWIEEIINTVAWLAFVIGAKQVYDYTRAHFGVDTEQVKLAVTA